jgi:hypothetical protein
MEMDGPSLVKDRHQKYARIGVFAGGD